MKTPLPIIDASRTEFGFARTSCGCDACVIYCKHMPGYLIPDDLRRLHAKVAPEMRLEDFAAGYLSASPGAVVRVRAADRVVDVRVPTLVPRRDEAEGRCVFLKDGRCTVHEVAPFGCAFFDCRDTNGHPHEVSAPGLRAVIDDAQAGGDYSRIHRELTAAGLVAASPEESRARMRDELEGRPGAGLPFEPEDPDALRARYGEAVAEPIRVSPDAQMPAGPLPRKHVFDFRNGLRLIVTRDLLDDGGRKRCFIHVSASLERGSYLYGKVAGRKGSADEKLAEFDRHALHWFGHISGYARDAVVPLGRTAVALHYLIELEANEDGESEAEADGVGDPTGGPR